MSLVGPRPPIPYEVECYDLWHQRRVLELKPGITGLWQVRAGAVPGLTKWYGLICSMHGGGPCGSISKILLQTPLAVFGLAGAHCHIKSPSGSESRLQDGLRIRGCFALFRLGSELVSSVAIAICRIIRSGCSSPSDSAKLLVNFLAGTPGTARFARCVKVELAFTTIRTPSAKSAHPPGIRNWYDRRRVNDDPVKDRSKPLNQCPEAGSPDEFSRFRSFLPTRNQVKVLERTRSENALQALLSQQKVSQSRSARGSQQG